MMKTGVRYRSKSRRRRPRSSAAGIDPSETFFQVKGCRLRRPQLTRLVGYASRASSTPHRLGGTHQYI
jgi:hypothetical protein